MDKQFKCHICTISVEISKKIYTTDASISGELHPKFISLSDLYKKNKSQQVLLNMHEIRKWKKTQRTLQERCNNHLSHCFWLHLLTMKKAMLANMKSLQSQLISSEDKITRTCFYKGIDVCMGLGSCIYIYE